MMERIVLDTLEARRMMALVVGSCSCGLVLYLENDEERKEKKKKKTYHPPSSSSIPIPTNHRSHRKNSIQHHNPH